jgi:enoyl-CoA hydratase/carnithine racemase
MLRLSRPAKRNALDDASSAGIESPLRDPPEETRTIILHAEGKHFMAGEFAQSGRLNELVLR